MAHDMNEASLVLSIPYWDFLVLNPFKAYLNAKFRRGGTFNSLLGFSSFESPRDGAYRAISIVLAFQFPIGIF